MKPAAIALTCGEPAGIGPDLSLHVAHAAPFPDARLVLIGDRAMLQARAAALGLAVTLTDYQSAHAPTPLAVEVLHVAAPAPVVAGRLDARNGPYVLRTLDRAIEGCLTGEFAAMVTAPVHKAAINEAGIAFTGHTEYLAEKTGTPRVVMMLVGGGMRVALATTHLALAAVPAAITQESLSATLRILHRDLVRRFGIAAPRIVVAGLNPHAGESGYLGREEIDVIEPVLARLCGEGMQLEGPLPADTLFTRKHLDAADAVLAMYHDQGLPVLKYASFGAGVNVTLGLPLVRTSVDHGTALDLAATGRADPGSLHAAVALAIDIAAKTRAA